MHKACKVNHFEAKVFIPELDFLSLSTRINKRVKDAPKGGLCRQQ